MANAYYREAKLVPWYHQNKPRCKCLTGKREQCLNSASYSVNGPGADEMPCCKAHADILVNSNEGYRSKPIRSRRISISR